MRRYLKYLSFTLATIIVLLAIAVALLPTTLKWGINHWFEQQNLTSHIESIEVKLFDGQLRIQNLTVKQQQQPTLKLGSVIIRIAPRALLQHKIVLQQFSLDNFNLLVEQKQGQPLRLAGVALSANSEQQTPPTKQSKASQPWQIEIQHIDLARISSCYQQMTNTSQTLCAYLHHFNWQGRLNLALHQDSNKLRNSLRATLSLHLQGFKLEDTTHATTLAAIKRLTLEKIHLQGFNNIALNNVEVNDLTALPRTANAADKKPTYALRAQRLSANDIVIQKQQKVAVKEIKAHGLQVILQRDADGSLEANKQLQSYQVMSPTSAQPATTTVDAPAQPISLKLNHFSLLDSSSFTFIDKAVKPTSQLQFNDLQVSLQNLDSEKPQARSPLQLSLSFGQYGRLKLQGDVVVFAKRPTLKVKGHLTGINLSKFNAYTEQSIQHYVKSGNLDADVLIDIDEGKLDSTTQMTLQKFYVEPITEEEAKQYQQQLGLPLGTALSLLRNRDDSITLKLPVSGDIEAPDFSLSDIMGKVSSKAIKTAVINYYSPFGIINLASGLFNLATAIRFDPIEFRISEATLQPGNLQHLDKLARMLSERPQLHLVICGVTTQADRQAWFPAEPDKPKTNDDQTVAKLPTLTEAQNLRLNNLAIQRGQAVKEYLVKEKNIAADRLILCTPKHSPGDTQAPRVELQF